MTDSATQRHTSEAHWKVVGTILWGAIVGAAFVVLQVITTLVIIFRTHGKLVGLDLQKALKANADNGLILSWATITTTILCSLLLLGVIKLKRGATIGEYQLT